MRYLANIFFLLLITTYTAIAQNRILIDSLSKKLVVAKPSKEKVDLLNAVGWEYRFSYPDSTVRYAQQAYDLGLQLKLKRGLAKSLNFMGVAINYQGNRLKAYDYYQSALDVASKQGDSVQLAYSNNNMGRLLFEQGIIQKSFDYFVVALKLFRVSKDSSGTAYVKQSLANLYRLQKDYRKAEMEYLEAVEIRLRLKSSREIMSGYVQLAIFYQEMNQIKKASHYLLMADSIGQKTNDQINLAEVKVLLAENYLAENKINEAINIGQEGFEIIAKINNTRMLPRALLIMGKIQKANKQWSKARELFSKALLVAKSTKAAAFEIDAYLQLAEIAKLLGNKAEEIRFMNQYLVLKDSTKDLEVARQAERLQFELQIEAKEKENELLKLKQIATESVIGRQRLGNILLLLVVTFLIILAIFTWQVSKKRRLLNEKLSYQNQQIIKHQDEIDNQNEVLSKRNQMLSDLNNEKTTLMSIVAHDLKSPLNRITGLVSLIEMEGAISQSQKDYISKIKDVTQSGTDLIADLLDVHAIETDKNIPSLKAFNLAELIRERVEFFKLIANAKKIKIEFNSLNVSSVLSDPNYISRIIDNLLSNAIKFSQATKTVQVDLTIQEDKACIIVRDEGPGFSDEDKVSMFQKFKRLSARPTAGESSNGLGLAIVKTLVDRLKGEITLKSQQGKGSEFLITLPILA